MKSDSGDLSADDGLLNPPAYGDVVEAYGLDLLKGGADVSFSVGGNLGMHDGDIKLGDDRFNALFRLVQRWRFNAPTLGVLFRFVSSAADRRERLREQQNDVAVLRARREVSIDVFHSLTDEIGANELGRDAYAGAIVVVLHAALRRCWNDLGKPSTWSAAGPLVVGRSVGDVLEAAAANFRHADEWSRTEPPTPQQMKAVPIIADALGIAIAPDGAHHPFRSNVCPDVVEALAGDDYEELNRKFFAFAYAMVQST